MATDVDGVDGDADHASADDNGDEDDADATADDDGDEDDDVDDILFRNNI